MTRLEKFPQRQNFSAVSAPTPRQFVVLLLFYFALQTIIRTFLSATIDLDESEQLILTQKFAWGYGSQPPLYTWLQILFFNAFGISIFALALLKNLLLFSIYLFTYLNARLLTRNHLCGILAAILLLFIPQVSWESQRDLTHSVLATALVVATIFAFLKLRENSSLRYVAFGICVGLGILSKYNYAAFLVGFVAAALSLKPYRPLIWNKRFLLALLVTVALVSPHLVWAFQHPELLSETAYKFHQKQGNYFSVIGSGLVHLLLAICSHIAPLLAIYIALFWKRLKMPIEDSAKLFLRTYLVVIAGLVLAIFILRVTGFKDRWFEPIFVSLPLFLIVLAQNRIKPFQSKAIFILGVVVPLLILTIIPGRIVFAEKIGKPPLLNAPFARLKNQVDAAIPARALIIAENKWIGGNLRLLFPQRNVVTPELAKLFSATGRDCVVVWDATRHETAPPALVKFVSEFSQADLNPASVFIGANYRFYRNKQFRLAIATSTAKLSKPAL